MVHQSLLATLLPNSRQLLAPELPDMAHGINVLLANTGGRRRLYYVDTALGSISPGKIFRNL
jgi:hypothetical protein